VYDRICPSVRVSIRVSVSVIVRDVVKVRVRVRVRFSVLVTVMPVAHNQLCTHWIQSDSVPTAQSLP